jgi:hypothetical protein
MFVGSPAKAAGRGCHGPRASRRKADPTLAAAILEPRADPSAYVRKSVANHLNDIAKDRPDWLLNRLAGWQKGDPRTVWIIRHALRTLIKEGDPRALALIGVGDGAAVTIRDFCRATNAAARRNNHHQSRVDLDVDA